MQSLNPFYKKYLIVYILLFFTLSTFGQEAIKVDTKKYHIPLTNNNLLWYADKSQNLDIQQIIKKKFKSLPSLNLGYNPAKHWFKIELEINNPEQEIFLELAGLFEISNLYITQNEAILETEKLGIWQDFNERKVKFRRFVFPLKFKKKGKYSLYLEV